MKPILVIVPSLGRPQNAKEFLSHWRKTTSGLSDLLFVLEDNDPTMDADPDSPHTEYLVGNYRSLGKAFNAAFEKNESYDYYAALNDDHWIKTPQWEEASIDALEDGGIAYGNDLIHGKELATAPILDGDLVRALGYIAPPGIAHLYIDNAWMDIGRGIGQLHYMPEVIFEHMHPSVGKSDWDDSYHSANSSEANSRDHQSYQDWLDHRFNGDIERVLTTVDRWRNVR
jgi:hypothetical protein